MKASEIPGFRRFIKTRYQYLIKDKLEYYFITRLFDEVQKIDPEDPVTPRMVALD